MKKKTDIKKEYICPPGYWVGQIIVKDKNNQIVAIKSDQHMFLPEEHTWYFRVVRMR